jgi:peptidoglycan/xylan/chitin deacetylase (PgdA/CDA1 family)
VTPLLTRIACLLGVHNIARWFNRGRLLILVYHGVSDEPPPPELAAWHILPLPAFREQLRYLARHYECLDLDEAFARLRDGRIKRPTACITFDDGYANNREAAAPALQSIGLPATIYLATGLIGTARRLWTVELEAAFRQTAAAAVDLDGLGMGRPRLGSLEARVALASAVIERMKAIDVDRRRTVSRSILDQLGRPDREDRAWFGMMTWDDVRELERSTRIRFGAHTVDHEIVARLDDASLATQIDASIDAVRTHVDRPSRTFAWPNGRAADFDDRATRAVRDRGCVAALSTIDGLNDPDVDPWELRRVTVDARMDMDRFRLAASGFLASVKRRFGR